MNFKNWLKNEGHKELAAAYKNLLGDVPQDPTHHAEGSAFSHSKLVRKSVPGAIQELKNLQTQDPQFNYILSDLDFNLDNNEYQILVLSSWLHDVGKSTATTIGDMPFRTALDYNNLLPCKNCGHKNKIQNINCEKCHLALPKIHSYEHENSKHYLPAIEKLKNTATPEIQQLYLNNQDLIHFLIDHHMDFTKSNVGFPKKFVLDHFNNGKVKNTREMKLLLILMWADKMGRLPKDKILNSLNKNANYLDMSSKRSLEQNKKPVNAPFSGSPEEMNKYLKSKFLDANQRKTAIKRKFPQITDEELENLV